MNNKFKEQSLNRKFYRKFTLSWFSVTCFKHVGLLWPISALDRKQVRGYTQPFIRVQIKENIKAPRQWPFTNGQQRGKWFHLMTSSWDSVIYNTTPNMRASAIWNVRFFKVHGCLKSPQLICLTIPAAALRHLWRNKSKRVLSNKVPHVVRVAQAFVLHISSQLHSSYN